MSAELIDCCAGGALLLFAGYATGAAVAWMYMRKKLLAAEVDYDNMCVKFLFRGRDVSRLRRQLGARDEAKCVADLTIQALDTDLETERRESSTARAAAQFWQRNHQELSLAFAKAEADRDAARADFGSAVIACERHAADAAKAEIELRELREAVGREWGALADCVVAAAGVRSRLATLAAGGESGHAREPADGGSQKLEGGAG